MRRRPALVVGSVLVALTTSLGVAPASAAPLPDAYVLPGDAVYPEGSAVDEATGTFWISSTTDGTIFRGTIDDPTAEVFLPGGGDGRTTAIGLEFHEGTLYVAGGGTGAVWAYDAYSGELQAQLHSGAPAGGTFVNDVAVAADGSAWFTDSFNPALYRVARTDGEWSLEVVDLTGTIIPHVEGFNLNGIATRPSGRHLYVVHSSTGRLFRIGHLTRRVVEVDLGGATLTAGDGIEARGRLLYVVRNAVGTVARVRLSDGGTKGNVFRQNADPSFRFPTTAEVLRGRLLVVNSQFDRRGPGLTPELPFTVSSVPVP